MKSSMDRLYKAVGMSKQNFHQQLHRHQRREEESGYLWELMMQLRDDHPMMGARTMYDKLRPTEMGRDGFIDLYNQAGMKVRRYRNYRRTTDSSGVKRFPNLIEGLELTGVNQAYASDITYYEIGNRFYYLTFIMDLYSRRIVGWNASKGLKTEQTTIPCMQSLLKHMAEGPLAIFHSDGGGQYYCKEFLKLTKGRLRNSMGKTAYENPKAERLNGTIKNDYLKGYAPHDFRTLQKRLDKAVMMYNSERPHRGLNKMSPMEFEQSIECQTKNKKAIMKESTKLELCLTNQ
jgi:transposase InsO family protein